jgi:uncharacterized protein YxjI
MDFRSDCKSLIIAVGFAISTANSFLVGNNYAIQRKLAALQETYHVNDASGNVLAYVKRSGLDLIYGKRG